MPKINNPFVFELSNELYLIGNRICVELTDRACKGYYHRYREACAEGIDELARLGHAVNLSEGFNLLENVERYNLPDVMQKRIAHTLNRLEVRCSKIGEDHLPQTAEWRAFTDLSQEYASAIEEQTNMRKWADSYRLVQCALRV